MQPRIISIACAAAFALGFSVGAKDSPSSGIDWPSFRGPFASGIGAADASRQGRFKIDVKSPGSGHSRSGCGSGREDQDIIFGEWIDFLKSILVLSFPLQGNEMLCEKGNTESSASKKKIAYRSVKGGTCKCAFGEIDI